MERLSRAIAKAGGKVEGVKSAVAPWRATIWEADVGFVKDAPSTKGGSGGDVPAPNGNLKFEVTLNCRTQGFADYKIEKLKIEVKAESDTKARWYGEKSGSEICGKVKGSEWYLNNVYDVKTLD